MFEEVPMRKNLVPPLRKSISFMMVLFGSMLLSQNRREKSMDPTKVSQVQGLMMY